MKSIFSLYGFDWLAVVLTFWATIELGNRHRRGFVLMMLANVGWLGVALQVNSLAMILANTAFFIMNLRGWIKWRPDPADGDDSGSVGQEPNLSPTEQKDKAEHGSPSNSD